MIISKCVHLNLLTTHLILFSFSFQEEKWHCFEIPTIIFFLNAVQVAYICHFISICHVDVFSFISDNKEENFFYYV